MNLKVRKVGNSLGVVLPKEALLKLKVGEGDSLFLCEKTEGGYCISRENPDFLNQMAVARDLMKRYRNTLRELAK